MKLRLLLISALALSFGVFLAAHHAVASAQLNKEEDTIERSLGHEWDTVGDISLPSSAPVLDVPIITYHKIRPITESDTANQRRYITTPEELDAQLQYLNNKGYRSISLDELEQHLASQTPFQGKVVVITFDDGYQSQYDNALPILRKYNYSATFFIFTDAIDRLAKYMTWKEVEELSSEGMRIGDHTKTHSHLVVIKDLDKVVDEIKGSKEILETHLGKTVTVFAYPFGEYNDAIVTQVENAGFIAAVGVRQGEMQSYERRFVLKRFNANNDHEAFLNIFYR